MLCPDCQVLIVKNIKVYDRVQHSQKSLAKYSSMLPSSSNVETEEEEDEPKQAQLELSPTSMIRSVPKKRKIKAKPTKSFEIFEDIEFFHFDKSEMVQGKIIKKTKNGKYSVLVAKTVPPQILDISPIFIKKINQ